MDCGRPINSRHGHEPGWKFFRRNDGPLREVVPKGHPLQPVEGRALLALLVLIGFSKAADQDGSCIQAVAIGTETDIMPTVL